LAVLGIATAVISTCGIAFYLAANTPSIRIGEAEPAATFVGSENCAGCHRTQVDLWRPSQHKLAMQHASDQSVLGDFNNASFDYHGVHSRFFRQDGKFLVETDGSDGKLAVFEVKYTFGLDPLQQYLVEFPDGRVQALSLAWDSRPQDKGGQRWFHLYPNEEIKHDDILHWTKLNQNWNFMCAECHSTGVRKNYDAANDRFATTFSEISVGCEACHGQGSRHVAWARDRQSWWPFGKTDDPAMGLLGRFTERRGRSRYAYVHAVALHSAGRGNEAMSVLKESLAKHPNDRDTLMALISFSREAADISGALEYAERLGRIFPDDQGLVRLIQELRRQ
jgi:hypothetical protein